MQIRSMKVYLETARQGTRKPKLVDLDPQIPAAAWLLLRWWAIQCYYIAQHRPRMKSYPRCISSCTAYIEEITIPEDRIGGIGITSIVWYPHVWLLTLHFIEFRSYRHFRFSIGAPDKEAKFRACLEDATARNENAAEYPSLYVCLHLTGEICLLKLSQAFHGSPIKNWHSVRYLFFESTVFSSDGIYDRSYDKGSYLWKLLTGGLTVMVW